MAQLLAAGKVLLKDAQKAVTMVELTVGLMVCYSVLHLVAYLAAK